MSRTIQSSQTNFTYNGNEMNSVGPNTLSYDKNGNLTSDESQVTSFEYNWENKLRSATIGANSISLKYDPAGNRVQKITSAQGVRKYIVDVAGEFPVILLELEPQGNNQFEIKKAYIYANSQILAQYDSANNKYFYLHDRLGSVRQMINTSGAVVKLYTYNPFGETIEEQGTVDNDFKFTGQFYDKETGQYYLRNRQYIPYIARLSSRDLLMGDFNEPLSLHRYLYCQNDPVDWIDPSGLDRYIGITKKGHVYVGVDVWSEDGKKRQMRYDFSAAGSDWFSWGGVPAGVLGIAMNIFLIGPGEVSYPKDFEYDETKGIFQGVLRGKQSREEDEKMKEILDEQTKNPPLYSYRKFNCLHWSAKMYFGMDDYSDPIWRFILDLLYPSVAK